MAWGTSKSRTLPLTARQEVLWRYIQSCEYSPSLDEMAKAIGAKAKSNISRLLVALKERGYVDYLPNRSRSVVALDPRKGRNPALGRISTVELEAELARRAAG